MKYKVGDKVRIKSKEYIINNLHRIGFVEQRINYANKEATIEIVDNEEGGYKIDIDNKDWWWFEDLFDDSFSYNPEKSIINEEMIKDISEVVKKHNFGVSISENDGKLIIEPLKVEEEEDLPIDAPVMATNVLEDWSLRYYAGKGTTFIQGYKSKDNKSRINWVYIIPFEKFNPLNIEESLKYNIVK